MFSFIPVITAYLKSVIHTLATKLANFAKAEAEQLPTCAGALQKFVEAIEHLRAVAAAHDAEVLRQAEAANKALEAVRAASAEATNARNVAANITAIIAPSEAAK